MTLPLSYLTYLPINYHPGAFGFPRKYDYHTGIDLYCQPNEVVMAMEAGRIVDMGLFTGVRAGSEWWNETQYVMIQGASGIICYGEIEIHPSWTVGDDVREGEIIGTVIPVLPPEKVREDIPGHSTSMLHLELYSEYTTPVEWGLEHPRPKILQDPTWLLLPLYLKQKGA